MSYVFNKTNQVGFFSFERDETVSKTFHMNLLKFIFLSFDAFHFPASAF